MLKKNISSFDKGIEVGDSVTLKNMPKKWDMPKDTLFVVETVNPKDQTIITCSCSYTKLKYMVFEEQIEKVFKKNHPFVFR